ncbi:hypothetical protein ACJ5H2_19385 [Nocardioides sp. R1-1]|uniref:hypothetical protein n=1 Tax=Nocardioides sp. R1-1 TaxID=3383502 RepID=UPI0038CFDB92
MSQTPPYGAPPPPPGPPPSGPPPSGPPPSGPPSGPPPFPPPGPPGGPGGPVQGRGRAPWIVLGVVGVVLLVGLVVGLVVALAGDDGDDGDRGGDTGAGSPEEVVEDLVDAAEDGDCAAVERLLTEAARSQAPCESEAFHLLESEDVESEVHDASIDGSTASVPAEFTSPEGSARYTFVLEKVDGSWRVASYAASRTSSSEGAEEPTDGVVSDPPSSGSTGSGPSAGGSSTADAVPDEPAAVVEAFFDSAFAGDCATAEDLVTQRYLEEEGSCDIDEIPSDLGDSLSYDIGAPTVDDAAGTATVPVELTAFGTTQKTVVQLVREDGRWKIDEAD